MAKNNEFLASEVVIGLWPISLEKGEECVIIIILILIIYLLLHSTNTNPKFYEWKKGYTGNTF